MRYSALFLPSFLLSFPPSLLPPPFPPAPFFSRKGESPHDHLARRVDYAYSRTASAVFNTSFTTALAFVCTGVSPLMPISAFGWYVSHTEIIVTHDVGQPLLDTVWCVSLS